VAIHDDLVEELNSGRISRREFIQRMSAMGLAASTGTLLSTQAQADEPKKGGKITLGIEAAQTKDSIDPTKFYSTGNIMMGFTIYDNLVNRGPDLKPVPWLAESWEVGKDASDWVFKLRTDVTFHDGKPFTAEDVIYAYNRHIKVAAPNADFPIILSDTRVQITQNGYEDFESTTQGTGPFKVKEFKPGSRYVFERNDNYWGDDGPWVDEIEFVGIGDITNRVNALLSGDINVLLELDPKAVDLIDRNKNVELVHTKSGAFINLAMMLDRVPTNDPNVRLAIKHAINREQVVENVLKGYGSVGNDHPISPFHLSTPITAPILNSANSILTALITTLRWLE